jgi:hypothetical protein
MSVFALLTDEELERWKDRSLRREARLWQEARAERSRTVQIMIANEATAEALYRDEILVEISRRREAARSAV